MSDAYVVGAKRVFDFEGLTADPLFCHLAGGAVPSVDTIYDDLRRFAPKDLERLEAVVAEQGLRAVKDGRLQRITIDVDSTVTGVFGEQEGAAPGYNPRYPGRLSYHRSSRGSQRAGRAREGAGGAREARGVRAKHPRGCRAAPARVSASGEPGTSSTPWTARCPS